MKIITLNTKNTTYQIGVTEGGFLLHLYYGQSVAGEMDYLLTFYNRDFSGNPDEAGTDRTFSLDVLPQEYPCYGTGDYRTPAVRLRSQEGVYGCDFRYISHRTVRGKYQIPGLPAVSATNEEAQTTEIILQDKVLKVELVLKYGVLYEQDVITRSAVIRNCGTEQIKINKAASTCLDFAAGAYDILHFPGRYGLERVMERISIKQGRLEYGSIRGSSSHQENPFYIIADRETTEDYGNCYGLMLLYSGNFKCETEQDSLTQVRVNLGLQDEMFEYVLNSGKAFYTPEAAMTFSSGGFSSLSHLNHEMIRYHVCRGTYQTKPRPILINNWEATYFDFDGAAIREIARQAANLGVEMLVLDDGWYGERNSDNKSLGDWQVNEKKLGGPLQELVRDVNGLGLKFGLWIEPEMISEDSDLYRSHPDWVLSIPGRKPIRSRAQLVLDFSREEVVDYILECILKILEQTNVEYLKMDMNRSLYDIYSRTQVEQNAGVIMHKYVLGVYHFLEQLLKHHPNLLIEGCSGGGGRFDAGMLYYTPQIWCSDDTDAIERIMIQHGTSYGYPISVVGSHVSAVPNHQTGRIVSLKTRGVVAMAGSFGYELDLGLLSAAEKEEVKQQIKDYKTYWNLIHNGRYYRLHTPGYDLDYAAWLFVDKYKDEALLNIVSLAAHCNAPVKYIRCKGLDEKTVYEIAGQPERYWGSALMQAGLPIPLKPGEYNSWQYHIRKTKLMQLSIREKQP